jgi:hypothetical protein
MLDCLTEAVNKSRQRCENMQTTKHVTRMKYALKDLAAKLNRVDVSVRVCWLRHLLQKANSNPQLALQNPTDLQPLVDPLDRLPHTLGRMDLVNQARASCFLEELEK